MRLCLNMLIFTHNLGKWLIGIKRSFEPGLLMRPEHSETKAKTQTETKRTVLRPRPNTTRRRPVWSAQLHVTVKQIGMLYYLVSITQAIW